MSEQLAKAIAAELKGIAWNSGGNIWLVRWERPGSVVVMSDASICVYDKWDDFFENDRREQLYVALAD